MNTLSFPLSLQMAVIIGDRTTIARMLDAAAELALTGPVQVVDGGNCFNVYPVARALRRRTARLPECLGRIHLARAFTCYQMSSLLNNLEQTTQPILVLDLLQTFYDEDVHLEESLRLLKRCLVRLEKLSQQAPVVISARPPAAACAGRISLLETLQKAAGALYIAVTDPPPARPQSMPLPGFEPAPQLKEG
ncbi:MAG: hypothetical protein HGA53_05205 [Anaerolineaceae bacterium]|nr:hypothetical protein [Anaerolineaceae bacterium]